MNETQLPRGGNIQDLFFAALDLDADKREDLVSSLLSEDRKLGLELQFLLKNANETRQILNTHGPALANHLESQPETNSILDLAFAPGTQIDTYRIERELGRGHFAHVYLAKETDLDRWVALKASFISHREAQILAQFRHPNIVQIYRSFSHKPFSIIVMQYIEGCSLQNLLQSRDENPNRRFVDIFEQATEKDDESFVANRAVSLAEALLVAHRKNILHLDIKPSNILVDREGHCYLVDFNVSLTLEGDAQSTSVIQGGTPGFMASEQAALLDGKPAEVDQRADIFSLGKVVQLLWPKACFSRPHQSFWRIAFDPVQFVKKMMSSAPSDRPQSMQDVAHFFQRWLELSALEKNISPLPPFAKFIARTPLCAFFLFSVGPQLIGSAFNILYNLNFIVPGLGPSERAVFDKTLIFYNVFIYPVASFYFISNVWPILRILWRPERLGSLQNQALTAALKLSRTAVICTAMGWLPGILVFPGAIHLFIHGVEGGLFAHFALSCVLSWLLSLSFSLLGLQHFTLTTLYPLLAPLGRNLSEQARLDLRRPIATSMLFHYFVGGIPLGATLLLLALRFDHDSSQVLLYLLICLSFVGYILSMRAHHQMSRFSSAIMLSKKS